MKLEQQVVSLELAKKLKKLGVKQESLFYWVTTKPTDTKPTTIEWEGDIEWIRENISPTYITEQVSAFTVAELGEMLPDDYISGQVPLDAAEGKWKCLRLSFPEFEVWSKFWEYANTEADARAKMLIYLLENKLITL